jgi:hypothetical protein
MIRRLSDAALIIEQAICRIKMEQMTTGNDVLSAWIPDASKVLNDLRKKIGE